MSSVLKLSPAYQLCDGTCTFYPPGESGNSYLLDRSIDVSIICEDLVLVRTAKNTLPIMFSNDGSKQIDNIGVTLLWGEYSLCLFLSFWHLSLTPTVFGSFHNCLRSCGTPCILYTLNQLLPKSWFSNNKLLSRWLCWVNSVTGLEFNVGIFQPLQ